MSGPGAGNKLFQFGLNPNAEANVIWVLKRSTDLTPGSFTEIYRYEGPTMLETLGPNITAAGTATQFEITDENPPAGSAYYRLEAEFVPIQP